MLGVMLGVMLGLRIAGPLSERRELMVYAGQAMSRISVSAQWDSEAHMSEGLAPGVATEVRLLSHRHSCAPPPSPPSRDFLGPPRTS